MISSKERRKFLNLIPISKKFLVNNARDNAHGITSSGRQYLNPFVRVIPGQYTLLRSITISPKHPVFEWLTCGWQSGSPCTVTRAVRMEGFLNENLTIIASAVALQATSLVFVLFKGRRNKTRNWS